VVEAVLGAVLGAVLREAFRVGAEFDRVVDARVPLESGWISPAVEETLLVNEEMAHPVQEAVSLGSGALMRGAAEPDESAAEGAGKTVSGIVEANLRTL
jgi:hypothetical protein